MSSEVNFTVRLGGQNEAKANNSQGNERKGSF